MQEEIKMTLSLPPLNNRYYRRCGTHMVLSGEARAYKATVRQQCENTGIVPLTGDVCVWIDIYRARKSGDCDSFLKGSLDALQGVAYENDKQIVGLFVRRFDDRANPRLVITVAPSSENGNTVYVVRSAEDAREILDELDG